MNNALNNVKKQGKSDEQSNEQASTNEKAMQANGKPYKSDNNKESQHQKNMVFPW